MLFISILASVWFVAWLYFTLQKNEMMQVITCILVDFDERETNGRKNAVDERGCI